MTCKIIDVFTAKRDLRFLTVKGDKYQTVQAVNKLVKKIARTYYIVRETNKKSKGYHFHAILDCIKEPSVNWFKKGIHMNLVKVGKPNTKTIINIPITLTRDELHEWGEHCPAEAHDHKVDSKIDACIHKTVRTTDVNRHLERILKYMKKEQEFPAQYTDYMYVVSNKNCLIPY